jgi:serine phosphatase RsbU (regulator of sigma subunit)/PAS domain-containing protein
LEPISSIEDITRGGRPGLVEVLDALVEAVVIVSADGTIELANRAARASLGEGGAFPLAGQSCEAAVAQWLLSEEDGGEVGADRLLSAERVGSPVRAIHRVTGELRWWRPSCQPLSCGGEYENARLLVLEDVTAVKEAEVRTRVLAESGRALVESFDFEQRLVNVANMAIPALADWCALYLADESLNVRRVVTAHRNPDKQALAERIGQLQSDRLDPDSELSRVIRTGASALYEEISSEQLARRARTAEQLRLFRELALRSAVIVPLRVPGRTVGAMVLATAESRRRLTREDLELAEQLGRRAGVAIENARLQKQVADVAETLARSFLPPPQLPDVAGWEVASLYRPIVSELRIELGGDFLDLLEVGSCWFAVIGDIEGKGVLAATVSGLMRHGTRLAAQQRPDPAGVLEQLDEALTSYPSDVTATMLCARLGEAELTIASAGHPPPLVANLEGETRELRARGPMLGAFADAQWRERTFDVQTGDLVLFYTDGITEALGGRKGLGRDRLRMLLAAQAGRRPAEVAEALDEALGGALVRDDLAALALRRR